MRTVCFTLVSQCTIHTSCMKCRCMHLCVYMVWRYTLVFDTKMQNYFTSIGSNGTFSRANVPPGRYVLRIEAKDLSTGEKNVMATEIKLDGSEDHCTAYLINRGLRVEGQTLTVEFTSTGQFDGFMCILNRRTSLCKFSTENSFTYRCLLTTLFTFSLLLHSA